MTKCFISYFLLLASQLLLRRQRTERSRLWHAAVNHVTRWPPPL